MIRLLLFFEKTETIEVHFTNVKKSSSSLNFNDGIRDRNKLQVQSQSCYGHSQGEEFNTEENFV